MASFDNSWNTVLVGAASLVVSYVAWNFMTRKGVQKQTADDSGGDELEELPPRGYTLEMLKPFTGENGGRILVAISGKVYDVTTRGKSFYGPGGAYHIFAGRDATRGLAKMSTELSDVDNPNVDDLTLNEIDTLSDWTQKFQFKYKCVGHLVDLPEERNYTTHELREYDGEHGSKAIMFALRGKIYNVTKGWSFYGPGGGYHMLAGRDASRALAKMSLDVKDVDDPNIADLSDEESQTLDDWIEKLSKKYTLVGKLVNESEK